MPMEENIITFNVTNMITVGLMLAITYTVGAWGVSLWRSRQAAQ